MREDKYIERDGIKYYVTMGLEIHAEMKTKTKMWCDCKNEPDTDESNINICPICMAHPGTLPVPNTQAIQNVIKVGTAMNANIADFTEFDRKNYFYPDIPKGYQISQYKFPIVSGGTYAGVDIARIHLEEDTATSTHDTSDNTLVNFNRAGVPLMELVTEPCIFDAKTAVTFAKELQLLLRYLNVSDADMEKGHMRVEVNISVSTDPNKFGIKVEVKNINSFKAVEKSIEYETNRHIKAIVSGEKLVQETRGFDEASGTTKSQRTKENSEDYRYFPDPDITKFKLHGDERFNPENLKKDLPELPEARRKRYEVLNLKNEAVELFVTQTIFGNYFDQATQVLNTHNFPTLKNNSILTLVSNYLGSDIAGLLKTKNTDIEKESALISPIYIVELCELIYDEKLGSRAAKDLLPILIKNKEENIEKSVLKIAEEMNVLQISDVATLTEIIKPIIADEKSQKAIEQLKAGKQEVIMSLVGQVIRLTNARANPTLTREIFIKLLSE